MSLVQAIICNQFVLVCSEQQANLSDGTIRHDFRKVFKINEAVILGMTGIIQDNYYLFQDYLTPDFKIKANCTDSLDTVFNKVTARFYQMNAINKQSNVFSLVCGWNGENFEGKTFFMLPSYTENLGISDVKVSDVSQVRLINCGEHNHYDLFISLKDKYPFSILGCKNTFRDVLAIGVKFDKTIDENALFEVIKRPKQ